jgi:hypothetical protein
MWLQVLPFDDGMRAMTFGKPIFHFRPLVSFASLALLGLINGLCPLRVAAQDTTKVRPEQIQSLLDDFHLGRVTRVVGGLGVERLDDKEMALRKKFLKERLSVGFQKSFPIDRKEEHWEVDYQLKGDLLLRGELRRQGASEQGAVDVLFRHEY